MGYIPIEGNTSHDNHFGDSVLGQQKMLCSDKYRMCIDVLVPIPLLVNPLISVMEDLL